MLSGMLLTVYLGVFCSAFIPHYTFAATSDDFDGQIQPLAIKSIILDIASRDETMVAVGERGHVFVYDALNSVGEGVSKDSATAANSISLQGWQQVETPTQAHLTKAFFITSLLGWTVGHDVTILHTTNGGLNWHVQLSSAEIDMPLLDILFIDEKKGIAIGAYGMFYRTDDGGETWVSEYHQELLRDDDVSYLAELKLEDEALYLSERSTLLSHFNRVIALPYNQLLMVGELGLLAVSADFGRSWQKLDSIYDGSFFNALYIGESVWVMGLRGHVFASELNLDRWRQVILPTNSTINAGMLSQDGTVRLVGNGGVIIDVNSKSDEVELVQLRQGEDLVSIAQDAQGHIWVAGTKGLFQFRTYHDNKNN